MFMRMIYDEKLAQAAYLIGCQRTGEAVVIDPERDIDRYIGLAEDNGLRIVATAETHIHADFVSGSRELAERVGAKVYVSDEGDADWKYRWLDKKPGGGSYDHRLLKDGDSFHIGQIEIKAVHTPGHTPEHLVYLVTDHGAGADAPIGVATGDFVFVGDLGRPDLLESAAGHAGAMEPSARRLYQTVHKLDDLPDFVQVWPGHGAGSACGKALGAVPMSTVGYEKRFNPAIRAATDEQGFVDFILSGQPEPPLYFAYMKKINKEGPPVLGGVPEPKKLSVDELRGIDTKTVAVADTREWAAYRDGHIPGSLSLPLIKSFNTDAGSLIGVDEPIVLIVEPERLDETVRDLIRVGLDDIRGWFDASEIGSYADGTHRLDTVREVPAKEAVGLVGDGAVRVLDVRRKTEYDEGHIDGATNIAHTRLASRLDEVPGGGPLLVHCRSGVRSARASSFLQRNGFDVINLRGGYLAWEQAAGKKGEQVNA
ncbi:MAG: MBL fold metallo-hydrolase [Phycisphaerales bacterium]|nr:MBL fold metallo-hydrolase [Planctomycetota bacterium]MCH8508934.1 MBL fold metallo-hydrolase [Phycisphaerales bacterium]